MSVPQLLRELNLASFIDRFETECIDFEECLWEHGNDRLTYSKRLLARLQAMNTDTENPSLKDVQIEGPLGQGNWGQVYRGRWSTVEVALKTVRDGDADLLREISLLQRLRHPNIVSYYGTFVAENTYLVTELCYHGALRDFLQTRRSTIPLQDLIGFACDTACGMNYLHAYNIVHRDLAARNILVVKGGDRLVAKVGDFGLSRQVADYYIMSEESPVAVRWSAPEALLHQRWTASADIWSFGVVIYEIFEYGEMPFAHLSNKETAEAILAGERLTRPPLCPDLLYTLMQSCFQPAADRPSFAMLHSQLLAIFANPSMLESSLPMDPQGKQTPAAPRLLHYRAEQAAAISSRSNANEPGFAIFMASVSSSIEGSHNSSLSRSLSDSESLNRSAEEKVGGGLVRRLVDQLGTKREADPAIFFGKLFELNPDLQELFPPERQAHKLHAMLLQLATVVDDMAQDRGQVLELYELGRSHTPYNVSEATLGHMRQALLWTLAQPQYLGAEFTEPAEAQFLASFNAAWAVMKEGMKARRAAKRRHHPRSDPDLALLEEHAPASRPPPSHPTPPAAAPGSPADRGACRVQ